MSDQDESSSNSQSLSDHERPMKKARYIWQIKGRYRFRQGTYYRPCAEDCECTGSSSMLDMRPEWPIHRWQTRQMAKAVVDNTINKVIEDMGIIPLDHDAEDFNDVYESLQSPRNSTNLEDAAVMMAIQSHGLQQKKCTCQNLPTEPVNVIQQTPFHHRPTYNPAESEPTTSTSTSSEASVEQPTDDHHFEHDFLAQAVAVAIQKKGLNTFKSDHG